MKLKLWLKVFQQTKVQDQIASQAKFIKHLEKSKQPLSSKPSLSNSSKNLQRKENFQAHSVRPPSPWFQNQTKILYPNQLVITYWAEFPVLYSRTLFFFSFATYGFEIITKKPLNNIKSWKFTHMIYSKNLQFGLLHLCLQCISNYVFVYYVS